MSFPWNDVLSTGSALISAAAAFAAWRTSVRANETADAVATIEHNRWKIENTPTFDFAFTEHAPGRAKFHIYLNGPDHLGELDSVTIRVGDDDMLHKQMFPNHGPSQEELDNHVWGPWRFIPTTDWADQHGREVSFRPLVVGQGRPLSMERTRPGHWDATTEDQWRVQYADHPIRLVITCVRGDDTWVLARRISNPASEGGPQFLSWADL